MTFADLCGEHILSGYERGTMNDSLNRYWADTVGYVKFTLDGVTYRVIEDPEDGYRSCCDDPEIVEEECKIKIPNNRVVCFMQLDGDWEANDVLVMIDKYTCEPVMKIGTANTDDYYPYIINEWMPENLYVNM